MVNPSTNQVFNKLTSSVYGREEELKAFDGTKAGVISLVEDGVSKVPQMFIDPPYKIDLSTTSNIKEDQFKIPVIDLEGINKIRDGGRRKQIINEVKSDMVMEYSKHVMKLGVVLFELLSEALGLNSNRLTTMGCSEGLFLIGHYYPPCPEPEKTLGLCKHSDNDFLTVVL
ncbi:hypothetical protein Scep_002183 [Stephania cephalantha]|uniref:Isopenicillin N synthase-like Fe(2+) 2OG dioxygenase domain-containing protein n=1 Tax=Stephania cephalantha TaxID=152367 RepID=A0AAP0L9G7_9MAGN